MYRVVIILFFAMTAATPVLSDAWLRDGGRGFTSVSGVLRRTPAGLELETGILANYGLLPRLTIGLDLNERPKTAGHVLVFARIPLVAPTGQTRFALEFAAGAHHWQTHWSKMMRATLSLGHSFQVGAGTHGWLNLDAGYERRYGFSQPAYKLDLTVGLSSGPRLRPMLQIETTRIPHQGNYWTITPAILIDGNRFRDGSTATWLIGLERKSPPQNSVGLKLAIWRKF